MVFFWTILGLLSAQGGHCVACHPEAIAICGSAQQHGLQSHDSVDPMWLHAGKGLGMLEKVKIQVFICGVSFYA